MDNEFFMSHRNLRTPKYFHRLSPLELCQTTNVGSLTRGGIYPYLPLTNTYFLYHFIQPCNSVGCPTISSPPKSITKRSVDYNHTLTSIQCDFPVHMQCNVPLHVISCHMCNECYMDKTIHTTHRVSWINHITYI